ncbi:MAG: DUF3883 domain-containing protein [Alphaproteobacteria bacterium]|nr:DUF3883 domain-containing protein [Alphaproteobacteria bacterium]
MTKHREIRRGAIIRGAQFHELMRVETAESGGGGTWILGLVGINTEQFRRATLSADDIAGLEILDSHPSYDGDGRQLRLWLQAHALGIAWEFDPYFGLSVSRVDPLPHQLEAVYDYLLKLPQVRFLLADDAGAGKTIMSGLLIRELQLRGLAERILIVTPANLAFQWQRELNEKFGEVFKVLKGNDLRAQYGVNQWIEQKKIITSLDLAKRDEILPGLRQVNWDLVIVDEAHRMSARDETHKSQRYKLGELLRDSSDHYLLLTATPHRGDPVNFNLFLQLLDKDAYADVQSIKEAMRRRRAPFYLRRTKEAMVHFPKRNDDGVWEARKIFTNRIPRTVAFHIDGDEMDLYRAVSAFIKKQSREAGQNENNTRARAVGFLMALYQRRLASSAHAVQHSLENRANRLEKELSQNKATDDFSVPSTEDLEEMDDEEREKIERRIDGLTLSRNPAEVRAEIDELRTLASMAGKVAQNDAEAKLAKLKELIETQGIFNDPGRRLLIFTEYKDTLNHLVENLRAWGLSVGVIHGGMHTGSREEPNTRIYAEQQFRDGGIQVLVATEAAGEGINLQVCNILFNYDIPWNPNRLEQRMGRIHRYGQHKDCLIFNFVAANTIEGRVLSRLLEKLQEIRNALDDDAVFNVVGEVLPSTHVENVLRDYYAGNLSDADLEDRILTNVDEQSFRNICENALEGLAAKRLNLEMLIERRARATERRVVPETIARFLREAAELVPFELNFNQRLPHAFKPAATPPVLRRYERESDWKIPELARKYPACSTERESAEKNAWEWVTPGHPLFEAIRRHTIGESQESAAKGACFYSLEHDAPARMDFFRGRVVNGAGRTIRERLVAVEIKEGEDLCICEPGALGDFTPAPCPDTLPAIASAGGVEKWVLDREMQPFLEEVRSEHLHEIENISEHVEISLKELLERADDEIGRATQEKEQGAAGAEGRLAKAENRHDELSRRREERRESLRRQRALSLQNVERVASALILPHPERNAQGIKNLRQNLETEAAAMQTVIEHEKARGNQVEDVHEKNLGYDITSLDPQSGELRLIEIKGIGAATGTVLLTPNEWRVAEDRRDCYWLYIVTDCNTKPVLQEPVRDPARYKWHEERKVQHYSLPVGEMTKPMPAGGQHTSHDKNTL